jgi:ubiquinone/menaquinone biosynthesis C-methylase UbiE
MKNYDLLYQNQMEPWRYSERAIEMLRHQALAERVKKILSSSPNKSLLELGCSKGILSELLLPSTQRFAALEISASALEEAKRRLNSLDHLGSIEFQQGSALNLPYSDNSFQVVLAADGIHEWGFSLEDKQKVYAEIYRTLLPNGVGIFSDYLKPAWFSEVLTEFQKSKFEFVEVEYFGDRLSYQLEGLLKAFEKSEWAKKIVSNQSLAQKLQAIGKSLGPSGSRHMIWVGKKREN